MSRSAFAAVLRSPSLFLAPLVALLVFSGPAVALTISPPVQDAKQSEKKSAESDSADESQKQAAQQENSQKKPRKRQQRRQAQSTRTRLNAIEQKLDALAGQIEALTTARASTEPQTGAAAASSDEQKSTQSAAKPADAPEVKQPPALTISEEALKGVPFRSIGPANMGGRITDLVVHDKDPSLWWLGTASGGLLKTTNRGVTVEHQFDGENTVSIGAIAADPTNREVLWVGTGEANPRNSVSYGDGVYKSVDGGKTWKHMGLRESFQIGRILINPKDPDTVYVGALGRLYGPNRERGVFRTTDGGATWEHVLYVDDNTGVIDMIMHPQDHDTIIAALWDRTRDGFDSWPGSEPKPEGIDGYDPIRKWGPGAGLYKTTDGGKNWKKLKAGLPSGMTGRIGLDWQTGSPHTIYAIIDCEDIGKGPKPFSAFLGVVGADVGDKPTVTQLMPDSPAVKAGAKVGDVLVSVDGKAVEKFDELLDVLREKKIGERIAVTLNRDGEEVEFETKLTPRPGSNQRMPQVWLGVTGQDTEGGIRLTQVVPNGPAAKADLKKDDVIAEVNGKQPESYQKLIAAVRELAVGDELNVVVKRGEESVTAKVTLANRPGQRSASTRSNAYMGIQGEDAEGGGAKLTVVTEGGPSAKGGVKAGDVVQSVNDKELKDYQGLIAEIRNRQPEDKMKLKVKRGEKTVELEVVLGDRTAGSGGGNRPYTYSYFGQRPNVQDQQGAAGHEYGGIYKSTDAGETWQRVNSLNTRPMYFSVIRVDPSDDQRVYVLGVSQFQSSNGGTTFSADFGRGVHSDSHDLWIDPKDGRHMVIGCDGGFYVTWDRGGRWDHVNTAAIGQFYHVAIRPTKPYWVVGGLQDNGSWAGPAISRTGGSINEDWISVGGGDGFQCRVDPNDPDLIYYESQNGSMGRRNLRTGERASIRPRREQGLTYRFNWQTPFLLSQHNSRIFLCAGNYVFRSLDRGNNLQRISPELTLTNRGSGTALAESPRDPSVIYAGTDDGALWVTRDGGTNWSNITKNLGIPEPRWVATIEASRYADGRVYVCLDGHRSDDDNPYAFVSDDFGQSFRPLHKGIPWGSTRCLREDLVNENLLFLGTEFGFFVSLDRGQTWSQFNQTLPIVAVHEVAMHPGNNEIVLATHGRSLWAADVSVLRSLNAETYPNKIAFYPPTDVVRWRSQPRRGRTNRRYVAQNPQSGAHLWYSLPSKAEKVVVQVHDVEGQRVSQISASGDPGLHRVTWNLSRSSGRSAPQGGGGFRGARTRFVSNGAYRVTLLVDGKEVQSHSVSLQRDPDLAADAIADEQYEEMQYLENLEREQEVRARASGIEVRDDQ